MTRACGRPARCGAQKLYDEFTPVTRMGRLSLPWAMLAYPFYLISRSPGKEGSHYDPNCDLFVPAERTMVLTSNACLLAMAGVLAACTAALGPLAMFNLYFMPYVLGVVWLDIVTYLHHHGPDKQHADMPWCVGVTRARRRGARPEAAAARGRASGTAARSGATCAAA